MNKIEYVNYIKECIDYELGIFKDPPEITEELKMIWSIGADKYFLSNPIKRFFLVRKYKKQKKMQDSLMVRTQDSCSCNGGSNPSPAIN